MLNVVDYFKQIIPEIAIDLVMEQVDNISREDLKEVLDLATLSSSTSFLVLWKDEEPIAFSYGNLSMGLESKGYYFWLNEFYVGKMHRNKGYGSYLFKCLKDKLKEMNVKYLALVTGKMNQEAQIFYKKQGLNQKDYLWYDLNLN